MQQEIFVGIDVSKLQLEVALSTGEGFAVGNDQPELQSCYGGWRGADPFS